MLRLLQIEVLKVRPYRTFWAFLVIYAVIILIYSNMDTPGGDPDKFNFPLVWRHLAEMASFLSVLLGILVIVLITNEYSYRTLRQNVVDGLSREEVVTAKFVLIKGIAFICTLFLFAYGMIKGLAGGHFDHFGDIFGEVHFLVLLFLQMAGYMAIAAVCGFVIKKSGMAIVGYFLFMIAEYYFSARIPDKVACYLPLHVFGALLSDEPTKQLATLTVVFLTVGYFLLCLTLSRLVIQRSAL